MNPYLLLRRMAAVRSARLRLLGAWLLSLTGRRYVGLFLDPILACNLRCRMCYFSDAKRRTELRGQLDADTLNQVAGTFFPRALKLQIGCGAEPTLYKSLPQLITLGKQHKVPYISITTNGQLLSPSLLKELIVAGLDEVTLSLHGLTQPTYEFFMQGATFSRFEELCLQLSEAKKEHPQLHIRLNYTMNSRNTDELEQLPALLDKLPADVVQLRPVQRIGDTDWQDFSLTHLQERYADLLQPLAEKLKAQGITLLMPALQDLEDFEAQPSPAAQALQELTYCNIDPSSYKQSRLPRLPFKKLMKILFGFSSKDADASQGGLTKKMAYRIQ